MDLTAVTKAVLSAAEGAAGATWGQIKHDYAADLQDILQLAESVATKLASGELAEDEAEELLKDQSGLLFILTKEAEVGSKLVVQNAINAGIDTLWVAVKAAAKL